MVLTQSLPIFAISLTYLARSWLADETVEVGAAGDTSGANFSLRGRARYFTPTKLAVVVPKSLQGDSYFRQTLNTVVQGALKN